MVEVNPNYPGPKQAGPDGERYRIKDPAFFDLTLKYCLNCKTCEVACPSGVRVGDIIQIARLKYAKQNHLLRDTMLSSTDLVGTVASGLAPVVNPVLSLKPVKAWMELLGIDHRRVFPSYSGQKFTGWFNKSAAKAQEEFKDKIAYFHGCYVNYNYPQLGKDFVKVINACGYGVSLLDKERCCGVALISNGFGKQATSQARDNVRAIRNAGVPVLATSSTCTFTIRDEYRNVLGLDCPDMSSSVELATKWIYEKIACGKVCLEFNPDFHLKVVYHTACHMQKLGWALFSQELLRMIPGVELTVPEQHCCGIAGTFGFKKENYDYSQAIGQPLFDNLLASGADVVATDCETCKWQIESATGLTVLNPISILAMALK